MAGCAAIFAWNAENLSHDIFAFVRIVYVHLMGIPFEKEGISGIEMLNRIDLWKKFRSLGQSNKFIVLFSIVNRIFFVFPTHRMLLFIPQLDSLDTGKISRFVQCS